MSNSSPSVARTLLAIYLVCALSLGPVAAGEHSTTDPADRWIESGLDDELLNETTENTTDSLNETTESLNDTIENTTDSLNDTEDSLENTTDETEDSLENTTDETEDSLDNTTETVENTTEKTVENTTEELEDTTNETTESLGELDETLEESIEGTTAVLGGASVSLEAALFDDGETNESTPETDERDDAGESGKTTPATDTTTPPTDRATTEESAAAAGVGDDEGPTLPGPAAAVGVGAVVAGAAGVAALSGSGSGVVQSSGATALQTRGAATGARSLLSGLGEKLWRLGAVLRYSRWDDSDPLEHEGRREIFDTVEDNPGIYLSKVDEQTERSLSSIRHHLRILEEENLITTEKVRGKRRYFPVKRGAEDPSLVAALDDPATEAILTTLAETGPASGGDLADELDRDPSTVSHHLSRLEEEGLVERERDGRAVVNKLSGTAATALSDAPAASTETPAPADD